MQRIKVNFKNSDSEQLQGVLELPSNQEPHNFILFAHCFTCNKNFHAPTNISASLASKGYGVLRFDFTGLGDSEGEFENTNFSGNVEDLIAAAKFLEQEYSSPTIIVGHSLGGAAAMFAAKKISSMKCIATINAPSNLEHLEKHFENNLEKIEKQGFAKVNIGGRSFRIKKQFVDDLRQNNEIKTVGELRKAFLILHSPNDKIVNIKHAEELYKAARHPKSFVSLDTADHMLSQEKDSNYAGNVIAAWATSYIDQPEQAELETDHEVMANLGDEGYTTQIITGKHHFLADEPESVGGKNLGPNPYELVSSGLAACTSMTIQMYARRKNWHIENVETHVSYSKKHAEDCENCEDNSAKIDTFEREIILKSELDDKQIQRIREIADKCPVHKTLSSKSQIITNLKT
ncbi:bifunctional alpha/beta hydrolase/OsmC family protein [Christiangramia salexigens]|uniref:Osmotically inducible protein C n=1 Tax=Christiangramia salexigens TaxID=1913577 RepID=A0A1L3J3S2_9FLAO|nr:bifunctional alpha/beta hydrolase/OsmC family protein [Christiangramia salexigens]APG59766.1 osmotically inducible protein C [Christiangramia salexigens]